MTIHHEELDLIRTLPENPIVVDGGGGHGDWTGLVLQERPGATSHIYEPHFAHLNILFRRFADDCRVTIHGEALAHKKGKSRLYIDLHPESKDFGSGLFRRTHHKGYVDVQTARLDSFELPRIDLLKLDLEGGELDALDGMGHLRPEVIQFEYSINTWSNAGSDLEDAVTLLDGKGYRFVNLPPKQCHFSNVVARRWMTPR